MAKIKGNNHLSKDYKDRLERTTTAEIVKIVEKTQLSASTIFCWASEQNNEPLMAKMYNINVLLGEAMNLLNFSYNPKN